jgi:acyl-CoA synthetase (AMP-forming)/AMP-acid ligase II
MPSLLERLETLNTQGQVVSTDDVVLVEDLIEQAKQIRKQQPKLQHKAVFVEANDLAEFIRLLIAFDGWCEGIYLGAANLRPSDVPNLMLWPVNSQRSLKPTNRVDKPSQSYTNTNWFMATSGTTGQPKWHAHQLGSLCTGIKFSENLQSLNWGLLYQPFRFAGLQVVLQALLSGANLVDVAGLPPLEQITQLTKHQVTAISATPSLWRQLLMTKQIESLVLKNITLGGEIADQNILNSLNKSFPRAKIRHIYASTEAGVGFVVNDEQAGFPSAWLNQTSNQLMGLKISEQQHLLIKPKSKSVSVECDESGFIDTLDKVEVKQNRVYFLGRATGVINVGGNKVYPEKVEQVLLQSDQVTQAKVYAKKSPLMGALVAADICIAPDADEKTVKQNLLKHYKQHLERFEMPSKINVVEYIASNPSGKLNRKQDD